MDKNQKQKYLDALAGYAAHGPRSPWAGMHMKSLQRRYPFEYRRLDARKKDQSKSNS